MQMNETQLRYWICEIGRRLHTQGFVAAADGNISVRFGEQFLSTPSGMSKGYMRPGDIVIADTHGNKVAGEHNVTSEFYTHLAAYEERPEIQAVIHAHPTYATVLTTMDIDTTAPVLPELIMSLVALPRAPYATPGSAEGADAIRTLIRNFDAVLLDRHGAIVVGADLHQTYMKMERLEAAARTLYLAHTLGAPTRLSEDKLKKLMAVTVPPDAPTPPYPF